MDGTTLTGAQAEELACRHLKQNGLKLVDRNFHSRFGEIDLIMREGDQLVFVEVRYRANVDFGTPGETVTFSKQQKLIATAKTYLASHPNCPARFDVVAITPDTNEYQVDWIRDAFGA